MNARRGTPIFSCAQTLYKKIYEASDFYKKTKDTDFVYSQKFQDKMLTNLFSSIFVGCIFVSLYAYHLLYTRTEILLATSGLLISPFTPFFSFYMMTNVAMIGEIYRKENSSYDGSSKYYDAHRFLDAIIVDWGVYGLRVKFYWAMCGLNMLIAFVIFGK